MEMAKSRIVFPKLLVDKLNELIFYSFFVNNVLNCSSYVNLDVAVIIPDLIDITSISRHPDCPLHNFKASRSGDLTDRNF